MKYLELKKPKHNCKHLSRKEASDSDFDTLIDEDTLIKVKGDLPMLYLKLKEPTQDLLRAFQGIGYNTNYRTSGLPSRSVILGNRAAIKPRLPYCSVAEAALQFPIEHETFMKWSIKTARVYQEYLSNAYKIHMALLKQKKSPVLNEYIMAGTPFTSGIANKTMSLLYHVDNQNIPHTMSCMIGLKRDVSGGYLVLPEYRIAFAIANNTMLFFNGASTLHGVTHIEKESEIGYRYTAVFYSMKEMANCLPQKEEVEKFRSKYDIL